MAKGGSFFGNSFGLLKQTFSEWLEDKAPQLGAALAYYTVFSGALDSNVARDSRPALSRRSRRRMEQNYRADKLFFR